MERVLDLLNLSNLPDELAGLYTFFLNQIKYATNQEKIQLSDSNGESFTLDVWSAVYQRLLGVMTVAFESLTEAQWHTLSKVQASIEVTHRAIGELKPFLDFDAENGRCRFYHSTLPEFLEDAKLKQSQDTAGFYVDPEKWHQRIGRYYQQFSGSWSECDIYGFRHLPRHLAAGHQAQEIHPILIDFDWLQGKLIKTNILELLDDYDYLETLPKTKIFDGSTAKTPDEPVFLVQQALRLSAHVLAGDAQQLASQLIGRLQGFAEPELQKLVEDAVPGQSGSWLRPLHTTLTPPGNALLRTLTGHTAAVNDMAAIPDGTGRYIISASDDKTLKVWDLHDDVEARKTLRGHKDKVTAVAVTPDGKQAVSFSDDKTIKVWNLDDESETESASYDIETPLTKPMAVTCEGQLVGTTYDDEGSQFVRMWQLPGDFEPCENQTNAKEDGFAKRFARGVSSIAILSFNILILFYILASWFFGELIAELDILGIVFIIVFFIVACMRALFSEPNDIKVVDLPIEPQPADSNNSTESSNKKMNRSRKKVGGETAKRVKAVMFRFFGTTTIIFGIIEVSQIGSVSQEDTEFNLSFLAVILFFILLSSYAVKVLYSDETVDSIAIWLKEKRVMAVARNHTIKVRNLHNRNWRMILYGRLTFKVSTRLKPISAMAITADGNYMIYASDNSLAARRLKSDLRNRITSRVYLKQFSKNEGPISALVTLSDNEHVVSASQNALKLWNLKKGVWVARIGGIRQVTTLLVAPNDPWIISAANDGTLKVWDTSDVIRDTKGENHTDSNQIQGLSMAADGSQVISISISDHDQSQRSHHHTVRIWDKSDVIKDSTASLEFDMGRLDRMAIAPDGKQAVSVRGKHLMLWDLQDGKKMNKVRLHHPTRWKRLPKLVNVLVNKSTIALVVTYFIEFIKLFFSDLLFITFIIAAGATVYSSRGQFLGPYGRMLDKLNQRHAARNDRSKNLWRSGVNEGRAIREQLRAIISVRVGDFAVTPNGRFAVSALYKDVIVTNLEEKHQKVLRGHTDEITAVSVTPDGQHIVSAAQDNTVRVWHINQDDSRSSVLTVSCAVTALAIAADGQQVVFATKDHKLYAWRSVDDTATELAEKEGEITAVTLIHADQAVIVACRDRTVEVINLTTKRCEATYMGDAIPLHLSFTLNKNTVAVGDENGRFHLLQLEGMEIQTGQKVNYEYAQ